ncbi:MAG: DUF721 domain-containing protein [Deltaproteobacteria bacterium]|nr:DUF721 domain-containing protein [Deltaproteobacteria bacterium]
MTSRKRYNSEMVRPAQAVISELVGSSQWIKEGMTLGAILNIWEELVGPEAGKRLKPVELRKKRLLIQVPDSVWLNEIVFKKESIIKKINEYLKTEAVQDIKFYIK